VPCGIEASRAIVAGSCGSVVAGMLIQIPGSMCSPAGAPLTFTLASAICCRYVSPCMKMLPWTRPRFGMFPLMTSTSIRSLVTFSSRKWSDAPVCGRQMVLKPWPLQFPARPASGPSPPTGAAAAGAAICWSLSSGWKAKSAASSMDCPQRDVAHL
jgi:hypothetical protein